jgi:hypothetical protein
MRDITVIIPNRDGAVPEIWEALAAANINVEAAISFAREHHRVVHVVVAAAVADAAVAALQEERLFVVDTRPVVVVPLEDRPGGLADVTRTATEHGLDVYLLALATGNRVMLGAADYDAAREVFHV